MRDEVRVVEEFLDSLRDEEGFKIDWYNNRIETVDEKLQREKEEAEYGSGRF